MKTKAILPVSANPLHYGHLDIYNKAKRIFDEVIIAVAHNSKKHADIQKIKHHINAYGIDYVMLNETDAVADFCKRNGFTHIVRGVRNGIDTDYEMTIDFINQEIYPDIQTIFIPAAKEYSRISSTAIRELIRLGKFSVAKKYLDENALCRYSFGIRWMCLFGKSCVGKSTCIRQKFPFNKDIDTYLWQMIAHVYGEEKNKELREQSRKIVYSDKISVEEKIETLRQINASFATDEFWESFFDGLKNVIALDWASVGFYWDIIPPKYRGQMSFVEIYCSENTRKDRIKSKGFENRIKYIDSLYIAPKIIDERISAEEN